MTYTPFTSPRIAWPDSPVLSIVVPTFNEELNVEQLLERLVGVVEDVQPSYEIILVDDGSRDNTVEVIAACRAANLKVKLIALSRNFGKEAALNAGLAHASGQAVVQLDADLQHPPETLREFYAEWQNGAEIVYGERQSREDDGTVRRFLTQGFYRLFSMVSDVKLMKGLGDFLLMDRKVVDALLSIPERERFTKGLYAWVGYKRVAIPFQVAPRAHGQSAWSLVKLYLFALGALASFTTLPLKVWTYVGLLLTIPSFAYGGYIMIRTMILGIDVPGYASLMVALCFFSGVQLMGLGIIGGYLARVLTEVKQRPLYLVAQKQGFDDTERVMAEPAKITQLTS